jgi:hypothetical protein
MIIIIGLIILVAAVIVGMAGVLSNGGSGHALTHPFAVFGYHVTGSTGTLFLYGIVVGALAVFGLSILLAGARRSARRGRDARQGLAQSRRETAAVSHDRDDLLQQRDAARAYTASALEGGSTADDSQPQPQADPDGHIWQRLLGHRSSSPAAASPPAAASALAAQPAADVPAEVPADVPADVPAEVPAGHGLANTSAPAE